MARPLHLGEPTICDMNCFYPPNHDGPHQFAKKEEVVSHFCQEGCVSEPSRNTISVESPLYKTLDHIYKGLEGLELAISELEGRLQVVSSQEVSASPIHLETQSVPGTSDFSYRLGSNAERINKLEIQVQRMIRDLEI